MEDSGSLLHPKIARFYKINGISDEGDILHSCINEDCTFNWENLKAVFHEAGDRQLDDLVYPTKYDDFLNYFQRLEPLICLSHKTLSQKAICNDFDWLQKLHWLRHQKQMLTVLHEHQHPTSEASPMENVLFLTSVFENGLGNIFYTITGKPPPHLLRDLLDTAELKEFLGPTATLFLKILMGSPESVNLRNIVWHGFPLPEEIQPCYVSTLLLAAASISELIKEKGILLKSRHQLTDFSRYLHKILMAPVDLMVLTDTERTVSSIDDSKWTSRSGHKIYWHRVLEHYQKVDYWRCSMLLLPQIELVLRRMYGEANLFDITAKLEEYYITLNSIFEAENNSLLSGGLPTGVLHLMYDVFISPYGMRIRDKVSHGEVDLDCIDKNVCSVLLYMGLNLITSNENYTLDGYRSQFHLNCLAIECMESSKRSLLDLTSLKTPSDLGINFEWDEKSRTALWRMEIQQPVNIFNRPRKESELYAVFMRISQLLVQVCENYKDSFDERFRLHVNRELRSRARKTLRKMVETMPSIASSLQDVLRHLVEVSNSMQSEDATWIDVHFVALQRFCKQTLKIVENISRYSDKESNEWLNALECCENFGEVRRKCLEVVKMKKS